MQKKSIVLVGNPNSGKSSLFNALTGLNQQVGNFPGVTVDRKIGHLSLPNNEEVDVIDLPGTYSLYPRREDEWVSYKILMCEDELRPNLIVLVADASNLKRNLLFCSQILDLKLPVIMVLTMNDIALERGIKIDVDSLQRALQIPIVVVNPRKNKGIVPLKKLIEQQLNTKAYLFGKPDFVDNQSLAAHAISSVKPLFNEISNYEALHILMNHEHFNIEDKKQHQIEEIEKANGFVAAKVQANDVLQRYQKINQIVSRCVSEQTKEDKKRISDKIDDILLHRVWGYIILGVVLFLLFQTVFTVAQPPMDAIDEGFKQLTQWLGSLLPEAWWSNLLLNGVLSGIGGIVVFVPQIMLLFGLISILEDTGYMARISFLSDRLMRKVGLNGKSVMPMISGFACAVPAIMATRNIENKKERLLTILVTPLMSCSARLPVFTILIAMTVPVKYYAGFINLQGLVMMMLYIGGVVMAILVSYIGSKLINIKEKSFFILELPIYRTPRWKNIVITMLEKAKVFVRDAGKVIMVISLLLWFLSNYGPNQHQQQIEQKYQQLIVQRSEAKDSLERAKATEKLQFSYAGYLGRWIEPVIEPLGYDWKIGIALITSFAAREVFVGTMATLYSVEEGNEDTLKQKLLAAKRKDGTPVYTLATAMSLMIFYLLAMQCMSTLAVVKRETKSYKWPAIQLLYMTILAYLCSFIAYQLLS